MHGHEIKHIPEMVSRRRKRWSDLIRRRVVKRTAQ